MNSGSSWRTCAKEVLNLLGTIWTQVKAAAAAAVVAEKGLQQGQIQNPGAGQFRA